MNILVLQPIAPDTTPALRAVADSLLSRLEDANFGMQFDICQDDARLDIPSHPSIYMRHATVRNYMLDTYLKPEHDAVLWIDSDLVEYPADLPTQLWIVSMCCTRCHSSARVDVTAFGDSDNQWMCQCGERWAGTHIVAPLALLSPTSGYQDRFYDIGGFIEHGNRARMFQPWFDQQGGVIELDSVGCCYLAPAALYRAGVRYAPPPTDYYVEHWSVMQEARKRGYRVCVLTTTRVVHAWLSDYGMKVH